MSGIRWDTLPVVGPLLIILRTGDTQPSELFSAVCLLLWALRLLDRGAPARTEPLVTDAAGADTLLGVVCAVVAAAHLGHLLVRPHRGFHLSALSVSAGLWVLLGTRSFELWNDQLRLGSHLMLFGICAWSAWRASSTEAAAERSAAQRPEDGTGGG